MVIGFYWPRAPPAPRLNRAAGAGGTRPCRAPLCQRLRAREGNCVSRGPRHGASSRRGSHRHTPDDAGPHWAGALAHTRGLRAFQPGSRGARPGRPSSRSERPGAPSSRPQRPAALGSRLPRPEPAMPAPRRSLRMRRRGRAAAGLVTAAPGSPAARAGRALGIPRPARNLRDGSRDVTERAVPGSPVRSSLGSRAGALAELARAGGEHCGAERRHFEGARGARGVRVRGKGVGATRNKPGQRRERVRSGHWAAGPPRSLPRRAARSALADGTGGRPRRRRRGGRQEGRGRVLGGAAAGGRGPRAPGLCVAVHPKSWGSVCPHTLDRAACVRTPRQRRLSVPTARERKHVPGRFGAPSAAPAAPPGNVPGPGQRFPPWCLLYICSASPIKRDMTLSFFACFSPHSPPSPHCPWLQAPAGFPAGAERQEEVSADRLRPPSNTAAALCGCEWRCSPGFRSPARLRGCSRVCSLGSRFPFASVFKIQAFGFCLFRVCLTPVRIS